MTCQFVTNISDIKLICLNGTKLLDIFSTFSRHCWFGHDKSSLLACSYWDDHSGKEEDNISFKRDTSGVSCDVIAFVIRSCIAVLGRLELVSERSKQPLPTVFEQPHLPHLITQANINYVGRYYISTALIDNRLAKVALVRVVIEAAQHCSWSNQRCREYVGKMSVSSWYFLTFSNVARFDTSSNW